MTFPRTAREQIGMLVGYATSYPISAALLIALAGAARADRESQIGANVYS